MLTIVMRMTVKAGREDECAAVLQQQTSDKFLAKLAESKDVDAGKSEQLKNLQADTKSLSTPDQNHQINALVT